MMYTAPPLERLLTGAMYSRPGHSDKDTDNVLLDLVYFMQLLEPFSHAGQGGTPTVTNHTRAQYLDT